MPLAHFFHHLTRANILLVTAFVVIVGVSGFAAVALFQENGEGAPNSNQQQPADNNDSGGFFGFGEEPEAKNNQNSGKNETQGKSKKDSNKSNNSGGLDKQGSSSGSGGSADRSSSNPGGSGGTSGGESGSGGSGGSDGSGNGDNWNHRNPLQQPFARTSIWNIPIGTGAVYVPANLDPTPGSGPDFPEYAPMPHSDDEHIILRPNAPLTDLRYSDAGWTGQDRCVATGGVLAQVPIPTNYTVPHNDTNSMAVFLMPDGRTIVQSQPFARCNPGGYATSLLTFGPVDLYGMGRRGAHGGSGLSAIGGSLRVGELRPDGQDKFDHGPRHALKINVYTALELFNCSTEAECYRWPAYDADSGAVNYYGEKTNNQNQAMQMGALLAIPVWVDLDSLNLQTEPARDLAWTLKYYGAYIVDSTGGPGIYFSTENGPGGSFVQQFQNDWGFPFGQRIIHDTPWVHDMQKIIDALYVVNNNGPNNKGGGGEPLQPLAPPISPE